MPRGSCRPRSCSTRRWGRCGCRRRTRAKAGSLVESIERRTKDIAGQLGRARAHDRSAGDCAGARSADRRAGGAARGRHGRRRHLGAAARRRVLSVGAQGVDDDEPVAGRSARDRPNRAEGRCTAEMDGILKGLGYPQGHGRRADESARQGSAATSSPKATRAAPRSLAFIQKRLEWIRAQMPRAFNTLVNPNMEVKRLPPEEEPGAPAAYGGAGSIDGKIPGRFWINLKTTSLHSKYSLADLTFHEAIPGHIWQGEYTHKMPLVRQLLAFNAYSEGWALYAEQLADELGAYESDAGRAARLSPVDSRSAPAGWSSTPASTPSAGRASRACSSSSTSTDRIPRKWRARSIATARGRARRAATSWGTARSTGSARRRRPRSARSSIVKAFNDTRGARRQRAAGRAGEERRRVGAVRDRQVALEGP